jgi:hypothetical protein
MSSERFCQSLIHFRKEGISPGHYFGARWIILKVLLAAIAIAFLATPEGRFIGFLVLGYLLGSVVHGWQSYVVAKNRWALQQEVIDWDKVEQLAGTSSLKHAP